MKRIALALAVFVSLMIPTTPSFAEWVKVGSSEGNVFYVDTNVRLNNGLIYFWRMAAYIKPTEGGNLSYKSYNEGGCRNFSWRTLQSLSFKQPMGAGTGRAYSTPNDPWGYPLPCSFTDATLETACEMAKNC